MNLSANLTQYASVETKQELEEFLNKLGCDTVAVSFLSDKWADKTDKNGKAYLGMHIVLRPKGETKEGQGHLIRWTGERREARVWCMVYKDQGSARINLMSFNRNGRARMGDYQSFVVDGELVTPQYGSSLHKKLTEEGAPTVKQYSTSTAQANLSLIAAIVGFEIIEKFGDDVLTVDEMNAKAPRSSASSSSDTRDVPETAEEASAEDVVGKSAEQKVEQDEEIPL